MGFLDFQTTNERATDATNKLVAALDTSASTLPKAFLRVLGSVVAGATSTLDKYAGFILLQFWAETASYEDITVLGVKFSPLKALGRRYLVPDPGAGTAAQLTVRAVSPTASGDPLPADSKILGDNGVMYRTLTETEINAATVDFLVEALEVGSVGDYSAGELQFIEPVGNLDRTLTVVSLTAPGEEEETENAYRARVIQGEQQEPQGGAYADYRAWAEAVSGVVSAYPFTGQPMEVDVYIEGGTAPDFIPDSTLLASVSEEINNNSEGIATRRPVNDAVTVRPIVRLAFDFEIIGFTGTDEEKEELEAGLDDRLRTLRPFIQGLDQLPRRDIVSRSDMAGIASEISAGYGRTFLSLQPRLSGESFERYFLDPGEKAKLGTVTYL